MLFPTKTTNITTYAAVAAISSSFDAFNESVKTTAKTSTNSTVVMSKHFFEVMYAIVASKKMAPMRPNGILAKLSTDSEIYRHADGDFLT